MLMLATWEELVAGESCPLCLPRPHHNEFAYFVRKLSVSSLYLAREQSYMGTCSLVYDRRHVVRIDQLTADEWSELAQDIRKAEVGIFRALKPDHVNVESLGNTVPHLHWHIIPRYRHDGRWGNPIWTTLRDEMPQRSLADTEYREMADRINSGIDCVV